MRPIKLTMTAFGPYSGREVVDFHSLEEKNLFLITGPTGAGKTTVFDAISYALYGESSGTDRPVKSLRCDSAPTDLLTEVELIFELKGKVHQVHRTPSQMKKKVRGEGFTEHKPQATLQLEGKDRPITGKDNVTVAIKDLIGLEVEQFRQIMMIPQGEFRKLLMAKSDERTTILKSIFQTTLYSTLQKKFSEEKRVLEDKIKVFLTKRIEAIEKINVDGETPEGQELSALISADDKHVDLILTMTEKSVETDEKKKEVLDGALQKVKSQLQKLVEEKTAAGFNNQKIEAFKKNKLALEGLEAQKEKLDEERRRLELLEKALKVVPVETNFLKLKKEYIETRDNQRALKVELTKAQEALKTSENYLKQVDSEENNHAIDNYQRDEVRLSGFVDRLLLVEKDKGIIAELEKQMNQLFQSKVALKKSEEKTNAELDELLKELEVISDLKEKMLELTQKKDKLLPQLELIERFLNLQRQYNDQERVVEENSRKLAIEKENVSHQEVDYKNAKKIWHLNQAALLAQELKSGEPCPVCGSKEHLKLAKFTEDHITEEALQRLEALLNEGLDKRNSEQSRYEASSALLMKIKDDLMILVKTLETTETLGGIDFSNDDYVRVVATKEDDLRQNVEQLSIELKKINEKISGQGAIVQQKEKLEEQLIKFRNQLEEKKEAYNQCEINLKEKVAAKTVLLNEIPETLQEVEKLKEHLSEVKENRISLVRLIEKAADDYKRLSDKVIRNSSQYDVLEEGLKTLEVKCIREKEELLCYLNEQGFDSLEEYRPYRDSLGEIETLTETIKNYDQTYHGTKQSHDQLKEEVKDLEYKALDSFDEHLDRVKDEESALGEQINLIHQRVDYNRSLMSEIREITKEMSDEGEKYKVVGYLSDVINGNNLKKLTFERYILATYLQDILVVANHRLARMTNNRYSLKISTNVLDKRSSSGLDLEVFDSYTGVERSVKTLSGGESFKASLAMALALAEVVQAYAGGIQLDTVFIDEGFGTLDQESLDSAINCLVELQDSGRLVGIISHVQELKERIKTQLVVEMDEGGSRTQFIVD